MNSSKIDFNTKPARVFSLKKHEQNMAASQKTKTTRGDTDFGSNSVDMSELTKKRQFHPGPT